MTLCLLTLLKICYTVAPAVVGFALMCVALEV